MTYCLTKIRIPLRKNPIFGNAVIDLLQNLFYGNDVIKILGSEETK